jgi:hypothetical protein
MPRMDNLLNPEVKGMNMYDAITIARKLLAEQPGMAFSKGKYKGTCEQSKRYAAAYNCLAANHTATTKFQFEK